MTKRLIKFKCEQCNSNIVLEKSLAAHGISFEECDTDSEEYSIVMDFAKQHNVRLSGRPITALMEDGKVTFIGVGYFDIQDLTNKL